ARDQEGDVQDVHLVRQDVVLELVREHHDGVVGEGTTDQGGHRLGTRARAARVTGAAALRRGAKVTGCAPARPARASGRAPPAAPPMRPNPRTTAEFLARDRPRCQASPPVFAGQFFAIGAPRAPSAASPPAPPGPCRPPPPDRTA